MTLKKLAALLLTAVLLLTASCAAKTGADDASTSAHNASSATPSSAQTSATASTEAPAPSEGTISEGYLQPYSDVLVIKSLMAGVKATVTANYAPEDIITFRYNADTVFPGNEDLAAQIIENGKNPGLGIRALHEQGITGEGVKVAIIDQNLAQPFHPEFSAQLISYIDVGTNKANNNGSMHGPAVASLLVGQSCGVAPGADLYFAAAPSWTGDSAYYADALHWIIEQNKAMPDGEKIRVVSVSAAPSGDGSPFTKNLEEWDKAVAQAQAAGILVLDCRVGYDTGIILQGYYDPSAPDDVTLFKTGFPTSSFGRMDGVIFAPTSYRTSAEAYSSGHNSYQYTGQGGLSWGIPYITGVLALGWQVDPSLTNEEIIALLFESAYTDADGNKVVNPPAFIDLVKAQ